jgi:hypothetical protein
VAEKENPQQQKPDGKPAEAGKPKKEVDNSTLPFLIEFIFTTAVIFLSLVFFTVVGISLFTGATLLDFILRAGVSTLVIGTLLVLIVRQISTGALSAGLGMGQKLPPQPMVEPEENEIKGPFKVK